MQSIDISNDPYHTDEQLIERYIESPNPSERLLAKRLLNKLEEIAQVKDNVRALNEKLTNNIEEVLELTLKTQIELDDL